MAKQTVQYKRTMKGSVGAGMGALFNASGRQFYILEHKSSSKYHRAGTSQKIIIDQIELGRNSNCQVRYDDESWPTVSRRHAAIERDEQGWKIIPLSQTNSTFVNGVKIETAWYLQNGDEIQLAVNGPKLGFIQPSGKQSLVSSIRLTERLNLFRAQALKPYKTALGVMSLLLVTLSITGGYIFYNQDKDIRNLQDKNEELAFFRTRQDSLNKVQREKDSLNAASFKKRYEEQKNISNNLIKQIRNITGITEQINKAKKSIYVVFTEIDFEMPDGRRDKFSSLGTGFLLEDGRFVTARHCVQPWLYGREDLMEAYALNNTYNDVKFSAKVTAYSMHDNFSIPIEDFVVNNSYDVTFPHVVKINGRNVPINMVSALPVQFTNGKFLGKPAMYGMDWAYAQVGRKGNLIIDSDLSSSLKAGTEVHVLGYPAGLGVDDGKVANEPIYNKMTVSRDGLNKSNCIMVSMGTAHGNSGGPVFAVKNGKLKVIGIVSRAESATQQLGEYGIIQEQQQFDHLVPICNLK